MNKYKFIDYLHHPEKMSATQEAEIDELIQDHPYFQTARTLLAKAKKSHDPQAAKSAINSAAIYVFDRAYLKKYLDSKLFFIESKEEEKQRQELASKEEEKPGATVKQEATAEKKAQPTLTSQQSKTETKKPAPPTSPVKTSKPTATTAPQTQPVKQIKEVDPEVDSLKPPTPSELDKLIEEVYKDMAELKKSKARFLEWQEKNDMEEAVEKAMAAAMNNNSTDEAIPPKNEIVTPKSEDDTRTEEATTITETPVDANIESTKVEDKGTDIPETQEQQKAEVASDQSEPTTELPHRVDHPSEVSVANDPADEVDPVKKEDIATSEKTDIKESKPVVPKVKDVGVDPPKAKTAPTRPTSNKTAPAKNTVKKSTQVKPAGKTAQSKPVAGKPVKTPSTPVKPSKDVSEKIIDEFIEKQPSISKPNPSSPSSKDDLSKDSGRFHADIASEYLAEIYIEQGKASRAIEIYKSLILKYPEKKSYFAGLIQKLKK